MAALAGIITAAMWAPASFAGTKADQEALFSKYSEGSFGYFQWVKDEYPGTWKAADADNALKILNNSAWKNYTHKGDMLDATYPIEFVSTLSQIKELNQLRKDDNNFPNLKDVHVNNAYMARAQVNANAWPRPRITCRTFTALTAAVT